MAGAAGGRPGRPGRALAWGFANTLGARLGGLAVGIVLARVLGPGEFGSYAVAFVALMAILAFNDLGVSLAVVRWADDPADVTPTVNTVSLLSSAVLTLGIVAAAGPFAAAMGDPGSAHLVRLLALCVLINAVVATPAALLQRTFRADLRTWSDQVNVWLGAVVSLALALCGVGALSLVVGRIVGAGVAGLMLLRFSPLPYRFGLDRAVLRRLLAFGVPLAGASAVVFGIGFADQLVVGHRLGPTLLGAYVLAFNLASWPVQLLSQPLRAVAPAVFARQQHEPERMRESLRRMVPPLAALALPACAVLAVAAPEVIALVYGDAWSAAAEPLRWLAVLAAFRILSELSYDYVVVAGSSRSLLAVQLVWLAALLPALLVGTAYAGLAGAAVAQSAVAAGVVGPAYLWLLGRLGVGVPGVLRSLVVPAAGATTLAVAVLALGRLRWPPVLLLAVAGLLSLAVAGVLLHRARHHLGVWREDPSAAQTPEPVLAGAPA